MNKKDITTIVFFVVIVTSAMIFSFRHAAKTEREHRQKAYAAWVKYTKRTDISFEEWVYLPKNSK